MVLEETRCKDLVVVIPQEKTFKDGLDFIRKNSQYDNWFLQIETFDSHEPFTAPEKFQSRWFDPDKPFMLESALCTSNGGLGYN